MTRKPSRAIIPRIRTVSTKQDRRRELRARRRAIAGSRDIAADGRRIADHALVLIRDTFPILNRNVRSIDEPAPHTFPILNRNVRPSDRDRMPLGYAPSTSAGAVTGAAAPVTITLYEPLPAEPDVSALLRDAYALGIRVIVPITLPDLDLDWAQWSPEGIGQPLGKDAVADVTVAFVPGLSVDDSGTRMGQGGGCYDRTLPRIRSGAPVVCVVHPGEDHTMPLLPREGHDVPVNAVLTADGIRWVD